MKILRPDTLLAILLTVASFAFQPAEGASRDYANIHAVAVISALGDDIYFQKIGPTVFNNSDYMLHVEWKLDEVVSDEISKSLEGHYAVVAIDIDSHSFDVDSGILNRSEIQRRILALPKREGIDAYVIVLPNWIAGAEVHPSAGTAWHGIGVDHEPGLFGAGHSAVGINYAIGVFSAATGETIDYGTARRPSTRTLTGHEPPAVSCTVAIWADTAEQLGPEKQTLIHQEVVALLGQSIAYTLASAKIIDVSDADKVTATIDTQDVPVCQPGLRAPSSP